MNNKNTLWIILGVALILIVILGAYYVNQPSSTAVIKVGIVAPLTGPLASYGEAFRNGFELATEQGYLGKDRFVLFFEDSKGDAKTAISAYRKLVDVDRVNLVVVWGSAESAAISPLTKVDQMPMLASSSYPESVRPMSSYAIRIANSQDDFVKKLFEYSRSKGYHSIGVAQMNMDFFNSLVNALEKQKNADENIIVVDSFTDFGQKDFQTTILKIKETQKVDFLGVLLLPGQVSQFYLQASQFDLNIPTFGTDVFESEDEFNHSNGLMAGAVYSFYDVKPDFTQTYKTKYGKLNQVSYAASGYDVARIISQTVNSKDREVILQSLKNVQNFDGALGPYQYMETANDGYYSMPIKIREIEKDGNMVTLRD